MPTTQPFTVANGTASWVGSGSLANITATDRAVLIWNSGAFNIGTGEIYSFQVPGGSVLNKVGYLASGALGTPDTAVINGTLSSNGRVFVLANGNILVGGGASIQAANGLVLSTLAEADTFNFTTSGNLALTGVSTGNIALGNGTTAASTLGNLSAYSGNIAANNISVSGDLILNQASTAGALVLTGAGGNTTVGGNLTVVTNNGNVTQGSTGLRVGGTGTFNVGTGNITLGSATNDFGTIQVTASGNGSTASFTDANGIVLGASTVAGNLSVSAGGNITTSGAVAVGNTVSLSTTSGNISYGTGSSAGTINASSSNGSVAIDVVGNITTGALSSGGALTGVTLTTAGAGYTAAPTVTVSGGGVTGATAVATVNTTTGAVTGVTITVPPGQAYTSAPTITLAGGGTLPTTAATGTAAVDTTTGAVTGITVGTAGAGYTAAPTVALTGGGGSGATATATINTSGAVTGFTVTGGTGYTSAPTVGLTGGGTRPTTAAVAVATTLGGASVAVNSTGIVTVGGNISANGANVTVTGTSVNQTTSGAVLPTANVVTYNATAGNVVLGDITANRVIATANGGSISQNASGIITTTDNNVSVLNAGSGNISLTNNNLLNNAVLNMTGNTVSVTSARPITLSNVTTTGNLNVVTVGAAGAAPVTLGAGFGTAAIGVNVGGALNITTNGSNVSDDTYAGQTVFGPVNINAGTGNVSLTAATGAIGAKTSYGQFNITGNAVTINETQSINFGNVTAGAFTTNSTNGSILFNGNVTANSITANANSASITQTAPLSISGTSTFRSANSGGTVLDNTANSFGGAVTVTNGGNNIIVAGSNFTLASGTSVTGGNLTIRTTDATNNLITIAGGNATAVTANSAGNISVSGGTFRNLTLSAGNVITQTGGFQSNNTLTLSSGGNITLGNTTNNLTTVVMNGTGGDATIATSRNLTVSGTASGGVLTVTAGAVNTGTAIFANAWNLTLGNLSAQSLVATASNGAGLPTTTYGVSGNITQSAGTSIHTETTATFQTLGGNIVIGNNGNSFGRIQATTNASLSNPAGAGAITIVEDPGMRIGNISTTGNVSLTSRFGSIIEDTASPVSIDVSGATSVLTLSASNGSVALGGVTNNGTTTGNIVAANITAQGSAAIRSSGNLTLGPTSANSLTVISGNNIAQSGPLNVFALSTFNATNSITLTNPANNFGPLSLTTLTANQNIAVTEGSTMNLRTVSFPGGGNGTFTATSLNGDIIDTGLGGVKPAGITGAPSAGVITLAATNGNIILDDPTTDLPTNAGVVFNAKNVTLSVLGAVGANLVLGANGTTSVATGNLTATSALGNIGNAGAMTVAGNAFFQTGNGNITIAQPGVGFGSLRFVGNQVSISEGGNMDILTGSSAFGPAQLVSGGNISIVDAGGGVVTFGNTVSMQAAGNITLKQVQAVRTLTVTATGTKDLSALSLSADLNSQTPVDAGTGPGPSTVPALAPKP